ncbi:MAG: recombinase family protein [Roseiarcus sp.]
MGRRRTRGAAFPHHRRERASGAERVLRETASGATADRAQMRRMIAQLSTGDVLAVARLDRLARSTRDLLNTLSQIGKRPTASV